MFKQVASAVILIIVYKATVIGQPVTSLASNRKANGKPEELLAGTAAAKAIERLGDLSPAVVRERLKQMREPDSLPEVELALAAVGAGSADEIRSRLFSDSITVFSDEYRAQAVDALPASIRNSRITAGKLLRRVEAVVNQVTQLHGRSGKVELFIFQDDIPFAMLWRGCVLTLSAGLAGPRYDGELAGVMAHELGHSYFEDEMVAAQRTKDARAMRVVELKCDGVALLSLKLLGHNPALYLRGLQRIQAIKRRKSLSSGIFQSHPELVERAQFAQRFIKSLG